MKLRQRRSALCYLRHNACKTKQLPRLQVKGFCYREGKVVDSKLTYAKPSLNWDYGKWFFMQPKMLVYCCTFCGAQLARPHVSSYQSPFIAYKLRDQIAKEQA
jgi:hypothetical protein